MVNWIYAGFLSVAYIFQTTILNKLTLFGASPDIILVVLIACSVNSNIEKTLVLGFITGFLTDLLSGGNFGLQTAVYTYSAVAAGFIGLNLLGKNAVSNVFVTAIVSASIGIVKSTLMYAFNIDRSFWLMIFRMSVLATIYNSLISFFIYVILDGITSQNFIRRR